MTKYQVQGNWFTNNDEHIQSVVMIMDVPHEPLNGDYIIITRGDELTEDNG